MKGCGNGSGHSLQKGNECAGIGQSLTKLLPVLSCLQIEPAASEAKCTTPNRSTAYVRRTSIVSRLPRYRFCLHKPCNANLPHNHRVCTGTLRQSPPVVIRHQSCQCCLYSKIKISDFTYYMAAVMSLRSIVTMLHACETALFTEENNRSSCQPPKTRLETADQKQ